MPAPRLASRMVRFLSLILAILSLPGLSTTDDASSAETLTPQQMALLSHGKPLILEREIPDQPWPELTIWQLVKCTPEELAGVFWDSELDANYLPGCLDVRILSRPTPSIQKARFRLKMPFFLPDEVYVSEIRLLPAPPGSYRISWKVLESIYAKSCDGEILIQPHEGMTLIRYKNFMVPRSKIAVLLRGPGRDRVVESVHALVAQTEKEVAGSPALLDKQRQALRLATQK